MVGGSFCSVSGQSLAKICSRLTCTFVINVEESSSSQTRRQGKPFAWTEVGHPLLSADDREHFCEEDRFGTDAYRWALIDGYEVFDQGRADVRMLRKRKEVKVS